MLAAKTAEERTEYTLPKGYLSFSQIRAYLSCPRCYEMAYVEGLQAPVGLPLAVGCGVHGGLAAARRAIRDGKAEIKAEWVTATQMEFTRGAGVEVPEFGDATTLLSSALDSGDARIERDGTAMTSDQVRYAMDAAVKLLLDNVDRIVAPERAAGYDLIECEVWTEPDVLPFPFQAILDCTLSTDPMTVDEFKTADKSRQPDYYNGLQLRLQALNLWSAKMPFQLSLTQLIKNPPVRMPLDTIHRWKLAADDSHMVTARETAIRVAEGISRGYFPERPGWWCKFTHSVPPFVSVP